MLVKQERLQSDEMSGIARVGQARFNEDQVEELYTVYKEVERMAEAAVENARTEETRPPQSPEHEEAVRIANDNIGLLTLEPEACLWVKMFC